MPAHQRGNTKPEAYFGRIIAAICAREGGVLRLKGAEIDSIDKETILVADWDGATQELVIRVGTRFVEMYKINPEQGAPWQAQTTASEAQSLSPNSSPASQPRNNVSLTNEQLADIERKLQQRRVAYLIRQEREAAAKREADLFKRAGVPEHS